jgi:hypothetical protein
MKENDEFQHFLDGGKIPKIKGEKANRHENETFVIAYTNLISQLQNEPVPGFDAFEKLNQKRKTIRFKKLIPYAAVFAVFIFVSSVWFFNVKQRKQSLTEQQQILETQQLVKYALLHFSKELNKCMIIFEDAKKMQQPYAEMTSLKNYEIDFHNPLKNLKIRMK